MAILRQADVITTTSRRLAQLAQLAGSLLLFAVSMTAAADWRRDAVETLLRESGEHRLVVLGEMHGTREVPLLASDLVEHWSRTGPVLLALEIPVREHAALRAAVTGGKNPMTAYLHDLDPVTIDIAAERGQFWACPEVDACGVVTINRARPSGRQPERLTTIDWCCPHSHRSVRWATRIDRRFGNRCLPR
ncbi:hypothetical protein [Luteimonas sp. 100069]|uniref:hypothetical protein n=1 Tax=Luteimonas sp. 100069 TaxID=2006109 RepID=UPI000F50F974|nr:hypothetical protein [Luteimonas sp. 100069]RPD88626.1 hypothetical protein EGK76_05710 [Luteimonas sp. 100069]